MLVRSLLAVAASLGLAVQARAQLTEVEGRALMGPLFDRVYDDLRVASASFDSTGVWPAPDTLPNQTTLRVESGLDGAMFVEFSALPFPGGEEWLRYGPLAGTLTVPVDTEENCRTVHAGVVSHGWIEWEGRGRLDASGAESARHLCRIQSAGAG